MLQDYRYISCESFSHYFFDSKAPQMARSGPHRARRAQSRPLRMEPCGLWVDPSFPRPQIIERSGARVPHLWMQRPAQRSKRRAMVGAREAT